MMFAATIVAAIIFRSLAVRSASLRQWLLFGVLIHGVMFARYAIEVPVLNVEQGVLQSRDELSNADATSFENHHSLVELSANTQSMEATEIPSEFAGDASISMPLAPNSSGSWTLLDWIVVVFASCWVVGFVVLVNRSIVSYSRFCHTVSRLKPVPGNWNSHWEKICKAEGVKPPLMLASDSLGPLLFRDPMGYKLIVPTRFWKMLSIDERQGVMLHELAHLTRHDVWRLLSVRLMAAIHWWNPAGWWCVRRFEESVEWACDERLSAQSVESSQGLASSLIHLVEFQQICCRLPPLPGVGVQCMATPPLTRRISRLVQPPTGDPIMKRLLLSTFLVLLIGCSVIQFRLVAAPPQSAGSIAQDQQDSQLDVISIQSSEAFERIKETLDTEDPVSAKLEKLMQKPTGQIALAGALNNLASRARADARSEAIPRFVDVHFTENSNGRLTLRSEKKATADEWFSQSSSFHKSLSKMVSAMNEIGQKVVGEHEADQMARRMLTDKHAALVVVMEQFDGQLDPIDRFLGEAFKKLLVQRGEKMVVIPNLGQREQQQIERFELATKIAPKLHAELKFYAEEFATPDDRHVKLVRAMNDPAMSAILSLHLAEEGAKSPRAAIEKLIDNLEGASRDTPEGLVIDDEEAWHHLFAILEQVDRAKQRYDSVCSRLHNIARELDSSDGMSARFAAQMQSDVLAYFVAAEIPYAELDLSQQLTDLIASVMETDNDGGMRVRADSREKVMEQATSILSACRRVRRYVRQIDSILAELEDPTFAENLGESGSLMLLREIRNQAEQSSLDPYALLKRELFMEQNDGSSEKLVVRDDRAQLIDELVKQAREMESELTNDDF